MTVRGATVCVFLATALSCAACAGHTVAEHSARASNEFVLSAAESKRLVAWARRFGACMARRGVHLGTLVVTRREIRMPLPADMTTRAALRSGVACGDALGGPPSRASLQTFGHGHELVLNLPKRCLLDAKVAATQP